MALSINAILIEVFSFLVPSVFTYAHVGAVNRAWSAVCKEFCEHKYEQFQSYNYVSDTGVVDDRVLGEFSQTIGVKVRYAFSKRVRVALFDIDDFARLKASRWLSGDLISAYAWILDQRNTAYVFFDTICFNLDRYTCMTYWEKHYRAWKDAKNIQFILGDVHAFLVPVHVHKKHWLLAVVNLKKKMLELWDSQLTCTSQNNREKIFMTMRWLLDCEGVDHSAWKECVRADSPRQSNGYDCGIFVCKIMRAFVMGLDARKCVSQAKLQKSRVHILWELRDGILEHDDESKRLSGVAGAPRKHSGQNVNISTLSDDDSNDDDHIDDEHDDSNDSMSDPGDHEHNYAVGNAVGNSVRGDDHYMDDDMQLSDPENQQIYESDEDDGSM